jgi:hypothetical protein
MRLSALQVKEGVFHPDQDVRQECLAYFTDAYSRDSSIAATAIQALEQFGRRQAFDFRLDISHLAHTEQTIRWVVEDWKRQPRRTYGDMHYLHEMEDVLLRADIELLLPYQDELDDWAMIDGEFARLIAHRLAVRSWDTELLWRELKSFCGEEEDHPSRYVEGRSIVQTLACRIDCRDRLLDELQSKDTEDGGMTWNRLFMAQLAGDMRFEPATESLAAWMEAHDQDNNEEVMFALIKIGTDQVLETLVQRYAGAKWDFRLWTSGVLGGIHSDRAVEICTELLGLEKDEELTSRVAESLVKQFSNEGNELARQTWMKTKDPELQRRLFVACKLLQQDIPEMEKWRRQYKHSVRDSFWDELFVEATAKPDAWEPDAQSNQVSSPHPSIGEERGWKPAPPFVHTAERVGRNDACPCGSGKKFKKCCLRKQNQV